MIEIGRTIKAVGLRGEIKIHVQQPELLEIGKNYYLEDKVYTLEKIRFTKKATVIKFLGVDSIEEAQGQLQKKLSIKKEDIELEEGEFFESDLLGLKVIDEQGVDLGEIVDILYPSSQTLYVIRGETEFMLPAVKEFILSIDLDKKEMTVSLIEGLR
ncbi:MAG TPA: ribosome maturation factor RimM [Clostridia bacterium]|nr:ribosome maturation factor RimM [Clostridia bacterium]